MEKSAIRGSTALNSTKTAKQAYRDVALQQSAPDSHLKLALSMTVAACVLRLIILFVTPLELHPDEAQYWLWSRHLDLGYFSKPPLIAWLIAATTAVGGDTEPWVRLSGPFMHAATGLFLFFTGRRLYSPVVGLLACALYTLIPGVQLSSLVISTDAPLLALLSAALLAYVSLPKQAEPRSVGIAALMGAAVGAAALAKYAAVYGLIGIAAHLLIDKAARRAWSPAVAAAFLGTFALLLAPNLAWNADHHFATVTHLASNANWTRGRMFNPDELGEFLLGQLGVFGPPPALLLVAGLVLFRGRLQAADRLLLCWAAPPLLIVSLQALLSRANANWAGAAYPTLALLLAAWLIHWRKTIWVMAVLSTQGAIALLFLVCVVRPDIADRLGASNSLKRSRGWAEIVQGLVERSREEQVGQRLSAVTVDDRFLFNAAAYYGRSYFGHLGAPPLTMWVRGVQSNSQAETENPLTLGEGQRVLAASYEGQFAEEMALDFMVVTGRQLSRVRLDHQHNRRMGLFIGETYARAPRNPATGIQYGFTRGGRRIAPNGKP